TATRVWRGVSGTHRSGIQNGGVVQMLRMERMLRILSMRDSKLLVAGREELGVAPGAIRAHPLHPPHPDEPSVLDARMRHADRARRLHIQAAVALAQFP